MPLFLLQNPFSVRARPPLRPMVALQPPRRTGRKPARNGQTGGTPSCGRSQDHAWRLLPLPLPPSALYNRPRLSQSQMQVVSRGSSSREAQPDEQVWNWGRGARWMAQGRVCPNQKAQGDAPVRAERAPCGAQPAAFLAHAHEGQPAQLPCGYLQIK